VGFFQMISNPTLYRRAQRFLLAAVALSLLVHFTGILVWGVFYGRWPWPQPEPKEQLVVLSSSMTIGKRTEPVPSRPTATHHASKPEPPPKPPHVAALPRRTASQQTAVTTAERRHRELSYTTPSAPPTPQPRPTVAPQPRTTAAPRTRAVRARTSMSQWLARDEQLFQREVAQLRARDNPLSVATIAPLPASAYRRSYIDISGVDRNRDRYEGIVSPVQTWTDGKLRCHYASYDVEYSSGANDKGNIPWPLCYAPDRDPMMLPDGTPVPNGSFVPQQDLFPMEGYALPPGTFLTQFLRALYMRRL
jgi:hypothetical protein